MKREQAALKLAEAQEFNKKLGAANESKARVESAKKELMTVVTAIRKKAKTAMDDLNVDAKDDIADVHAAALQSRRCPVYSDCASCVNAGIKNAQAMKGKVVLADKKDRPQ